MGQYQFRNPSTGDVADAVQAGVMATGEAMFAPERSGYEPTFPCRWSDAHNAWIAIEHPCQQVQWHLDRLDVTVPDGIEVQRVRGDAGQVFLHGPRGFGVYWASEVVDCLAACEDGTPLDVVAAALSMLAEVPLGERHGVPDAAAQAPTQETLPFLVESVRAARQALASVTRDYEAAYAIWAEAYATVIRQKELAATTLKTFEGRLRERALEEYAKTGDKKVAPGVGIREVTMLTYERDTALAWATTHRLCLTLDVKLFEAVAEVLLAKDTLPFVTVTKVPQATLAKEL